MAARRATHPQRSLVLCHFGFGRSSCVVLFGVVAVWAPWMRLTPAPSGAPHLGLDPAGGPRFLRAGHMISALIGGPPELGLTVGAGAHTPVGPIRVRGRLGLRAFPPHLGLTGRPIAQVVLADRRQVLSAILGLLKGWAMNRTPRGRNRPPKVRRHGEEQSGIRDARKLGKQSDGLARELLNRGLVDG